MKSTIPAPLQPSGSEHRSLKVLTRAKEALAEFWSGNSGERGELVPGLLPGEASEHPEGLQGTIVRLEIELSDSEITGVGQTTASGLWSKRREDVKELIERARAEECEVRRPANGLRLPLVVVFLLLMAALPTCLLLRYGWDDSDLRLVANMAQALDAAASGIVLVFAALLSVVLLESRMRARIASDGLRRARALVYLIDSHVLSHPDVINRLRERASTGRSPGHQSPLSEQGTIDYLAFAGCLARIAAKTGGLYAQWLPRDTLVREAEELFQTSLQIERNCLEKIRIIEARRSPSPVAGR